MKLSLYQLQQQCAEVQAIDYYLARELTETILSRSSNAGDTDSELLFFSIIAVSEALREGHSCLKLSEYAGQTRWYNTETEQTGFTFPDLASWHHYLSEFQLSNQAGIPLVYEFQRLYLRRYWQFESELAERVRGFLRSRPQLDHDKARHTLLRLFPGQCDASQPDWQTIAVANSLLNSFSIIAGGPGTGKTFTVTRLLAALQILADHPLQIAMVAPTGKAAQRLNESIANAKRYLQEQQLVAETVLDTIPETARTIHRLLGFRFGSHNFRFNEDNPLPYDVLLVDEISMIDLPLMARLFRAVRSHCRIILLGDADQLPSVAAGSILADLAPCKVTRFSDGNAKIIRTLTGCAVQAVDNNAYDHLTVLQKSHRFDDSGEIGKLARQVIEGGSSDSWELLIQAKQQLAKSSTENFTDWMEQLVESYFRPLFENQSSVTIEEAFKILNRFRFLCATRQGEHSVSQVNQMVEQYLRDHGWVTSQGDFYPGRPVLVTENHYAANLFNGDIGLIWKNPEGRLQAVFADNNVADSKQGMGFRWLSTGRLPAIETVYAMTIHKTQGSEFEHVALVLPPDDSPILSRELLYTGITRARRKLSVFSSKRVWQQAVKRKVQRFSGLSLRVFGDPSK